jgi:hypothetical protein
MNGIELEESVYSINPEKEDIEDKPRNIPVEAIRFALTVKN